MSNVGDCLRKLYAWMQTEEVQCALEWNQGGHFKDPVLRIAKAFAWVLNTEKWKRMKEIIYEIKKYFNRCKRY